MSEQRSWDRLLAKVAFEPNTGCWLWMGGMRGKRYGAFKMNGKCFRAHRAAYILANGRPPDGAYILHSCDQPLCVNPAHLRAGTQHDNMRDMTQRTVRKNQRLSWDDVRAIRRSNEPAIVLAGRYGVYQNHIYRIRAGLRWRHDPQELAA